MRNLFYYLLFVGMVVFVGVVIGGFLNLVDGCRQSSTKTESPLRSSKPTPLSDEDSLKVYQTFSNSPVALTVATKPSADDSLLLQSVSRLKEICDDNWILIDNYITITRVKERQCTQYGDLTVADQDTITRILKQNERIGRRIKKRTKLWKELSKR